MELYVNEPRVDGPIYGAVSVDSFTVGATIKYGAGGKVIPVNGRDTEYAPDGGWDAIFTTGTITIKVYRSGLAHNERPGARSASTGAIQQVQNNPADTTTTGGAQPLGALNAEGRVALAGQQSVGVKITGGPTTATHAFEYSKDGGTTWFQCAAVDDFGNVSLGTRANVGAISLNLTMAVPGGCSHARVRVSAYTSGSANVELRASTMPAGHSSILSSGSGDIPVPIVGGVGGPTAALAVAPIPVEQDNGGAFSKNFIPTGGKDDANVSRCARTSNVGELVAGASVTLLDSTTTPLGAAATFTGGTLAVAPYDTLRGTVFANVAGTLNIEQSQDAGATWETIDAIAVAAGVPQRFAIPRCAPHMRLRYVNGAGAQATFRLFARGCNK